MSSLSACQAVSWQAPELLPRSQSKVVKAKLEDSRGEQLLKWSQKKALHMMASAERQAEEMKAEARDTGYREGYEQALRECEARLEQERARDRELLEREQELFRQATERCRGEYEQALQAELGELKQQFQEALCSLALGVGERLALRSLEAEGPPLRQLVEEALEQLGHPSAVTIKVGTPEAAESLRGKLEDTYRVHCDETLAPWDTVLQSEAGEMRSHYQERLRQLKALLLGD